MEYYIEQSRATGRFKVYRQDGSMIAVAVFDRREQAEEFIINMSNQ